MSKDSMRRRSFLVGGAAAAGVFRSVPASAADLATQTIALDTDQLWTSDGGRWHADPARVDADVMAHPNAVRKTANGRFFRRDINTLRFEYFNPAEADALPAMKEMLSFMRLISGRPPFYACPPVRFATPSSYNFSDTIHLKQQVHFIGGSVGRELNQDNRGTRFVFPAGKTGITINRHDTLGERNVASGGSAQGSIIEGITLHGGGYAAPAAGLGTGSGIHFRSQGRAINCVAHYFAKHGFAIIANEDGAAQGEVNETIIQDCTANHNRDHGVFIDGNNANACKIDGLMAGFNGGYGIQYGTIRFGGPVNISIIGGHQVSNGKRSMGAGQTATSAVWLNNNVYYVVPGQAAGASTNSPSARGGDNQWWYHLEDGVKNGPFPDIPLWVSGIETREGGAAAFHGGGVGWVSPYTEGRQGPVFAKNVALLGGALGSGIRGGPYTGAPK